MNPDRTIVVPASYMGQIDAELRIFCHPFKVGEEADMELTIAGETIARGETFRRPQIGPWTWLDAPEKEVVATFGSFLEHAIESSEEDARDGWPILDDRAGDWTDALTIMGMDEES